MPAEEEKAEEETPTQIDVATMKEELLPLGLVKSTHSDEEVTQMYKLFLRASSTNKGAEASGSRSVDTATLQADVKRDHQELVLLGKQISSWQTENAHATIVVYGTPEPPGESDIMAIADLVGKALANKYKTVRGVAAYKATAVFQNGKWVTKIKYPRPATALTVYRRSVSFAPALQYGGKSHVLRLRIAESLEERSMRLLLSASLSAVKGVLLLHPPCLAAYRTTVILSHTGNRHVLSFSSTTFSQAHPPLVLVVVAVVPVLPECF